MFLFEWIDPDPNTTTTLEYVRKTLEELAFMTEKLLKLTTSLYSPVDEIGLLQVDRFWGIQIHNIVGNPCTGTGRYWSRYTIIYRR